MGERVDLEVRPDGRGGTGRFPVERHNVRGQRGTQSPVGVQGPSPDRVGKDRLRRADAGLMEGGEQTRRRAAMRRLWEKRTWRGGRHNAADRIGRGVVLKQLVTHLWTCLQ